MDKPQLRQFFLNRRAALTQEEWRTQSNLLCQQLQTFPLFTQAHIILAYISHRQEPDLSPLWGLRESWGLPRTLGKSLSWHLWQPGQPLQKGKYGIFEPHPNLPPLESHQVDLILVPAVACDRQGHRLGYGGGYYDRMLSHPDWQPIPTIGMIFDFALVPQLSADPWDIPLTAVCTPTAVWSNETKIRGNE